MCVVATLVSFTIALPLASAKSHDASHQFGERLLEHVEEHGAHGWRDRAQSCGSHTGYMLQDVDWFRDHDVGFFTSSLASYIGKLRSLSRSFICASWHGR